VEVILDKGQGFGVRLAKSQFTGAKGLQC